MAIVTKSIETLLADIARELSTPSDPAIAPSTLTDWNNGSKVKILSRAFASIVSDCWRALAEVEKQSSPVTATGDSLDLLVNVFNVYRKTGSAAQGFAIAIPKFANAQTVTIPIDEPFAFESVTFVSTSGAVFSAPYTVFPIECTAIGSQYNLSANTLLTSLRSDIVNNYNVYVGASRDANGLPKGSLFGGSDIEDDDTLRQRFGDALLSLVKGTYTSVYSAIAALTWVKSFSLVEYEPMIGYLTAYIDDGSSNTSLDPVNKIALNAAVAETAAAGIAFRSKMLEKVLLDVKLDVTVDKTFVVATVEAQVQAYVEVFLQKMKLGETLYTSKVESLAFDIPGVLAAKIIEPTSESVAVLASQVFRPKSVVIDAHV